MWSAYEAPGVNPEFICHDLNVSSKATPKKQLPRHLSKEHAEVVKDKVRKLKQTGAIKEVFYPEWLANTHSIYGEVMDSEACFSQLKRCSHMGTCRKRVVATSPP